MIVTACRPSQVRRHEHRVRSSAVLSRLRTIDRSARRSNEVMPHRNRAASVLAAVAAPAGTTISIVVVTALVCLAGLGALGAQAGGALNRARPHAPCSGDCCRCWSAFRSQRPAADSIALRCPMCRRVVVEMTVGSVDILSREAPPLLQQAGSLRCVDQVGPR